MMLRHKRFLLAFAFGAGLFACAQFAPLSPELRALLGVNAFFVTYLGLMLRFAQTASDADLRRHAEAADEGLGLILALAALSVGVSLTAIVLVLNGPQDGALARLLALAAAPLGWAMLHTLLGFHYAHLYHRPEGKAARGGLIFPGSAAPGAWDFLYFAFGIGMTAQVSDVTTSTLAMRKVVLVHAVASFFYNTIILALAVNAAVTAGL
jgi:uncharacterized membrane protein